VKSCGSVRANRSVSNRPPWTPRRESLSRPPQARDPAREGRPRRGGRPRPMAQSVLFGAGELAERSSERAGEKDRGVPESSGPARSAGENAPREPRDHGLLAPRGDERKQASESGGPLGRRPELREQRRHSLGIGAAGAPVAGGRHAGPPVERIDLES